MTEDHNLHAIKDIMRQVLKQNKLDNGILEMDIKNAWKEVMGTGVWNYTNAVTFAKGKLIITLGSSVLREELSYGKEKIITMLNEFLKTDVIKHIHFN